MEPEWTLVQSRRQQRSTRQGEQGRQANQGGNRNNQGYQNQRFTNKNRTNSHNRYGFTGANGYNQTRSGNGYRVNNRGGEGQRPERVPPPRATATKDPKALPWSALFNQETITKGYTILPDTSPQWVDGMYEVPQAIVDAGINHWSEYTVGFFVDRRLAFPTVRDKLEKIWELQNDFHIAADRDLFYFKFDNPNDKKKVLEMGPVFIAGRIFLVQPWSTQIEEKRTQINIIPIWVKIYEIPKQMWTTEGLGFLASLIGTPKYVDQLTADEERLEFAQVCVEIGVDTIIEYSKTFRLAGKTETVKLQYPWLPSVCTNCSRFGHMAGDCPHKMGTAWCPRANENGAGPSNREEGGTTDIQSGEPTTNVEQREPSNGQNNLPEPSNQMGDVQETPEDGSSTGNTIFRQPARNADIPIATSDEQNNMGTLKRHAEMSATDPGQEDSIENGNIGEDPQEEDFQEFEQDQSMGLEEVQPGTQEDESRLETVELGEDETINVQNEFQLAKNTFEAIQDIDEEDDEEGEEEDLLVFDDHIQSPQKDTGQVGVETRRKGANRDQEKSKGPVRRGRSSTR